MSCMSGSPNLNSFRDRGQVAVQLVSCGVLLPGLVEDCTQLVSAIIFFISQLIFHVAMIGSSNTLGFFRTSRDNPSA